MDKFNIQYSILNTQLHEHIYVFYHDRYWQQQESSLDYICKKKIGTFYNVDYKIVVFFVILISCKEVLKKSQRHHNSYFRISVLGNEKFVNPCIYSS